MTTHPTEAPPFVPGAFWDAERAARALREARAISDSPAMRALIEGIASATGEEHDPAATAAAMANVAPSPPKAPITVRREGCVFRRGTAADIPVLQRLIAEGELPPFYLEPFVEGFLVVTYEGEIIGCGGNEHYGDDAVLRSVVVDRRVRGIGLGAEIARLLIEDAARSGASGLYLFTMHAYQFWKRFGFADLELPKWPTHLHEQWQYSFCSTYPEAAGDVYAMWREARR